jgi:hypothetical protein
MGAMSELPAEDTHDVIHRGGQVVAVVVPIEEYRQLRLAQEEERISEEFAAAYADHDATPGDDRGDPDCGTCRGRSRGRRRSHRVVGGAADLAAYRRDGLDQGDELSDVVAVSAGQRRRQRYAVRFGDQMCGLTRTDDYSAPAPSAVAGGRRVQAVINARCTAEPASVCSGSGSCSHRPRTVTTGLVPEPKS